MITSFILFAFINPEVKTRTQERPMAATPSTMLELSTKIPAFELADFDGNLVRVPENGGHPIVVMFICNHCPFVKHIVEKLSLVARDYQEKGIFFYAINSNDIDRYPDDAPEKMKIVSREHDFSFPYLIDRDQRVAKRFRAACTPDFYLFDRDFKLVYRGQFDDSRPGNEEPVTGKDLKATIDWLQH